MSWFRRNRHHTPPADTGWTDIHDPELQRLLRLGLPTGQVRAPGVTFPPPAEHMTPPSQIEQPAPESDTPMSDHRAPYAFDITSQDDHNLRFLRAHLGLATDGEVISQLLAEALGNIRGETTVDAGPQRHEPPHPDTVPRIILEAGSGALVETVHGWILVEAIR